MRTKRSLLAISLVLLGVGGGAAYGAISSSGVPGPTGTPVATPVAVTDQPQVQAYSAAQLAAFPAFGRAGTSQDSITASTSAPFASEIAENGTNLALSRKV